MMDPRVRFLAYLPTPWRWPYLAGLRRACGLAVVLSLLPPLDAAAQTVSPAETLLFETDHLARIKPPVTLVYEFRKVSNVEPGFTDKVQLDLADSKGKSSATLHFLSGAHKHDIPALENAHGNPVLLGFLERDIAEMKRLTGGSTAYFRKRIRMALAEGARISTESIAYQGKTLAAQTVRIQPYLDDPMHARFEPYVHKTYTFVVSNQVPGGVYQLRTALRDTALAGSGKVAGGGEARKTAAAGNPAVNGPAAERKAPASGAAAGATTASAADQAASPLPSIDETLTLVSVATPGR
jgi:hypothetical protein